MHEGTEMKDQSEKRNSRQGRSRFGERVSASQRDQKSSARERKEYFIAINGERGKFYNRITRVTPRRLRDTEIIVKIQKNASRPRLSNRRFRRVLSY